jgi:hypothetical protein
MNKTDMKKIARGISEQFFYCDDECEIPWEPFEYWDNEDIQAEVADLANRIFNAMQRAQNEN